MESIQQMAARIVENMDDFSSFEDEVHEVSLEISQELGAMVISAIDDILMEKRGEGLSVEGTRERTIMTMFGSMKIGRRLYRDEDGNHRFLLDEALGIPNGSSFSPKLTQKALRLCSQGPFRFAAETISDFTKEKVSHATLHKMVASTGDAKNEEEEQKRTALFKDGELPQSEGREVDRLIVEADGVGIALQREEKKRTEIKLAVAYEGLRERRRQEVPHCG
ncbi:MAG: UPF0236 family protein [Actinomycetota bacterium]|nr:UPF0236 family protein [Actinomycetota bacterium]